MLKGHCYNTKCKSTVKHGNPVSKNNVSEYGRKISQSKSSIAS
jgi:hypothetical protein